MSSKWGVREHRQELPRVTSARLLYHCAWLPDWRLISLISQRKLCPRLPILTSSAAPLRHYHHIEGLCEFTGLRSTTSACSKADRVVVMTRKLHYHASWVIDQLDLVDDDRQRFAWTEVTTVPVMVGFDWKLVSRPDDGLSVCFLAEANWSQSQVMSPWSCNDKSKLEMVQVLIKYGVNVNALGYPTCIFLEKVPFCFRRN